MPMLFMVGAVLILGVLIIIVGYTIGRIEKYRIEEKQDYMEYLKQQRKEYENEERDYVNGLKKEKEAYEKILNELDRNTLPTKDQMKKLHWYMRHYGVLDQQQQDRLNNFYDNNFPKP